MRHNYSPSARGAKINQLDWVSLTKKFDQRQPNVTIPDFIPVFDSYTQIKTAQSIDTTGVALF